MSWTGHEFNVLGWLQSIQQFGRYINVPNGLWKFGIWFLFSVKICGEKLNKTYISKILSRPFFPIYWCHAINRECHNVIDKSDNFENTQNQIYDRHIATGWFFLKKIQKSTWLFFDCWQFVILTILKPNYFKKQYSSSS